MVIAPLMTLDRKAASERECADRQLDKQAVAGQAASLTVVILAGPGVFAQGQGSSGKQTASRFHSLPLLGCGFH